MKPILEARSLSKNFGTHQAVHDLSFSIEAGDVYGFLGENGAGKSTTMRMILGLIRPSAGTVYLKGEQFHSGKRHLLRHVGAVIERPDLYGYLSGWDNLRLFATLTDPSIPDRRLHEVLELVGLRGRERDKVRAYSQGMKQRLGIAVALVHQPNLLLLDEPTNGLDPQGIAEMRQLILQLSRDHQKTILISSHLLYEMEQMATRMLIVHKGRKMVEGAVTALLRPEETEVVVALEAPQSWVPLVHQHPQWQALLVSAAADALHFQMHPNFIPDLNTWLVAQGARVREIRAKHSLETYFLSLTHDSAAAH